MEYSVLGIGYPHKEWKMEKASWLDYNVQFSFVDTISQAILRLRSKEYNCIAIRSDHIEKADLVSLQNICAVPVIIMPPEYSAEQRQTYAVFSMIQYIHTTGLELGERQEPQNLKLYFESSKPEPKPLTIITVKELSFCLEHRSVEVCGKEVLLTAKEFDILSLLIMNQKRVFTYEAIMNSVWHEDITFYSPKAVSTHISNLRKKLKREPDVPEYIKSVRGIGYKFIAPE